MTEWISLVDGKCPFNPNHSLEEYEDVLFYCGRCDLIFQEKKESDIIPDNKCKKCLKIKIVKLIHWRL